MAEATMSGGRAQFHSVFVVYFFLSTIVAVLAVATLLTDVGVEYYGIADQILLTYGRLVKLLVAPWAEQLGKLVIDLVGDWWRLDIKLHPAWVHAFVLTSLIYSSSTRNYYGILSRASGKGVPVSEIAILIAVTFIVSLIAAALIGALMIDTSVRAISPNTYGISLIDLMSTFDIVAIVLAGGFICSLTQFILSYFYYGYRFSSSRPGFFSVLSRQAYSDTEFQFGFAALAFSIVTFAAYFNEVPFSRADMLSPVFTVGFQEGSWSGQLFISAVQQNRILGVIVLFGAISFGAVLLLVLAFRRARSNGKSVFESFADFARYPQAVFLVQVVVGVASFVVLSVAQSRLGF